MPSIPLTPSGPDLLETLPDMEILHKSSDKSETDELTCHICLVDFHTPPTPEAPVKIPKCGHIFGKDCLHKWLGAQGQTKNLCPSCRGPISSRPIVRFPSPIVQLPPRIVRLPPRQAHIYDSNSDSNWIAELEAWTFSSHENNDPNLSIMLSELTVRTLSPARTDPNSLFFHAEAKAWATRAEHLWEDLICGLLAWLWADDITAEKWLCGPLGVLVMMLRFASVGKWYEFRRRYGDLRASGGWLREYVPHEYVELCALLDGDVVLSGIGGHAFLCRDRLPWFRAEGFKQQIRASRVRLLRRLRAARRGREG